MPFHIDAALIELFRAEVETHMAALNDGLLVLEKEPSRVELFEALMRAAHSIKGAARIVGVAPAVDIAHAIEDCFVALRQGKAVISAATMDVLFQGVDLLQRVAQIPDDATQLPELDAAEIARVTAAVSRCAAGEAMASPPAAAGAPLPPADVVEPSLPDDAPPAPSPPAPQMQDFVIEAREHLATICDHLLHLEQAAGDDASQRILQLLRAVHSIKGGAGFFGCRTVERVAHLIESVLEGIERGEVAQEPATVDALLAASDRLAVLVDDIEHSDRWDVTDVEGRLEVLLAVRSAVIPPPSHLRPPSSALSPPSSAPPERHTGDRGGTLRIPVGLVDRLMTLAGELVLVRNQTRRSTEAGQTLPGPVVQRLDTVTAEFQETVLQTRMQPVANLFGKFPRLVRDLGRQLGKQMELEMGGTEVELDKTILDLISDPLTHLVRNSCDHGIELPDDRLRAGKSPAGRVTLTARHLGDQISITIADDGRGIDVAAVKRKAIAQGVRTADELARLDDKDLLALILLPGFSTASTVTDLSGRGVGMDVVTTNLTQIGGSLDIASVPGGGTTFTLRLPLTLAIIPCLLVECGAQRYAIPQKDLEELVCVYPGRSRLRIESTIDQELLRLRGRLLPLVRAESLLGECRTLNGEGRASKNGEGEASGEPLLVAIVKCGARRFGLTVDAVVASEEIVVKPMHASLRYLPLYSGVTILGDGKVALILNCEGIARHVRVRFGTDAATTAHATSQVSAETQSLLLFRSGREERCAAPLTMIRRIVMLQRSACERVGERLYATIDSVPTRLLSLAGLLGLPSPETAAVAYALLPRDHEPPLGFLVDDILDTVDTLVELGPPVMAAPGIVGSALIGGRLTSLVDLRHLAQLTAAAARPAPPANSSAGARILLVEDTQFFRELVKGYLEEAGHHVVTAEHGAEGLAALERQSFDLVVSDLEMPVLDGWGLATAVRRRPGCERLPLLALTTLSSAEDRRRARACGFDAFEVKLDRDTLLASVTQLLPGTARASAAGASIDG